MIILGRAVSEFHKNDGLVEVCAIEELSELIKAITKHQRGEGDIKNTIEEVGHVLLMCNTIMVHYGISEESVFIEAKKAVKKMNESRPDKIPEYKYKEV